MKPIVKFLFGAFILFAFENNSNAQCLNFVKTTGFEELNTEQYVPEGRFDAITLSEGDYLKVYKSFFRGRTYKLVIIADKTIPIFNFKVKTMKGDIVYDSNKNNSATSWEYTSDRNQNLMIEIDLPASQTTSVGTGCVAVILGHKI